MHYGIEVVPFGDLANPNAIAALAQEAEKAGWEGLWIWDHVVMPYGVGDPWVALAATAAATKTIKLCAGVSPLPRYRPHLLARTIAGLDLLSNGRVIFATGLGIQADFEPFGEPPDNLTRAEMLDEGLQLLTEYMSGEEVNHEGAFYCAKGVRIVPATVQKPHPPIWIGGVSLPALRRAACNDGWIMGTVDENSKVTQTPEQIAKHIEYIRRHRVKDTQFDVAVDGVSGAGQTGLTKEYEEAGATWWFEILHLMRGTKEELEERIKAGPPGRTVVSGQ